LSDWKDDSLPGHIERLAEPGKWPEYYAGIRVLASVEDAKRLICEWADQAGWAPVKEQLPSLVFQRKGLRGLLSAAEVDVELMPDDIHVNVSFVITSPPGKTEITPYAQRIVDEFAAGLSRKLDNGVP
jgi:outer membrane protein OmpA-like peptidoglycan-associated protein